MKEIRLVCRGCHAVMRPESRDGYFMLSCPYCGRSDTMLMDSDRVRIAGLKAESRRQGRELVYRIHRDRMEREQSAQKARIIVLCVVSAVVVGLIVLCQCIYGGAF